MAFLEFIINVFNKTVNIYGYFLKLYGRAGKVYGQKRYIYRGIDDGPFNFIKGRAFSLRISDLSNL